ncbi:uncharacterized protein METZ01_LOCUS327694, partial [marine metagenome]
LLCADCRADKGDQEIRRALTKKLNLSEADQGLRVFESMTSDTGYRGQKYR